MEESWKKILEDEFKAPYFVALSQSIRSQYLERTVFPPLNLVFNAFKLCPFEKVKVVIIGQDPYHGKGQAHGLSFSVQEGVKVPPSLQNIYKELRNDVGKVIPETGNLEAWSEQGVLLLNATLTVEANKPGSHQGLGWEEFTDAVIKKVSEEKEHVVFILWGKFAQSKEYLIDPTKHCVLKAAHPSPFSAYNGFFSCRHFSKTNEYLEAHVQKPIEW